MGMGAFIKSVNEQRRSNSISDMGRGKGRGRGRSKGWTTEGMLSLAPYDILHVLSISLDGDVEREGVRREHGREELIGG